MCAKQENNHRQCVICNRKLIGRSDKVFCDIKCKNHYHREVRKSTKTAVKETVGILKSNYVILAGLLGDESDTAVIDKLALEKLGFNFNHITAVQLDTEVPRYFIFEFAFEIHPYKRIHIRVDTEREALSPFIFKRWSRKLNETTTALSA